MRTHSNLFVGFVMAVVLGMLSSLSAEVLTSKKPEIKYNLDITTPLNAQFVIKHADRASGTLGLTVIDDTNGEQVVSVRHNFQNTEETFNIPLKTGKYIVKLSQYNGNIHDKPFEVKLNKIRGYFEAEPNNHFNDATPLTEKKYYSGYLQHIQNEDFYKISLAEDALVDILFKHDVFKDNGDYQVKLYASDMKTVLMSFLSSAKDEKLAQSIGLKEGDYYIKVSQYRGNFPYKEYNLGYITSPTKYQESEPNENKLEAPYIEAGYFYSGYIQPGSSHDYYKIIHPADGNIKVVLTHEPIKTTGDFGVEFYDEKGKKLDSFLSNNNDKKKESKVLKLPKGTYYIKVSQYRGDILGQRYQIALVDPSTKKNPVKLPTIHDVAEEAERVFQPKQIERLVMLMSNEYPLDKASIEKTAKLLKETFGDQDIKKLIQLLQK